MSMKLAMRKIKVVLMLLLVKMGWFKMDSSSL